MIPWMKLKIYGSRQRLSNMWRSRNDSSEKENSPSKASSKKLDNEKIQMVIIGDEGVWNVGAGAESTVEKLKTMALAHFYNASESQKLAPKFKLVSVLDKRSLPNNSTLFEEGIKHNEELLLVEAFTAHANAPVATPESLKGPTTGQIANATHSIKEKHINRKSPLTECAADFQHEVRKILMTLSETSAKILSPTPDSQKIVKLINEQLSARRMSEMNPVSVKALMDMGFTREQAVRGLRKRNLNHREALEWLIDHANDPPSGDEDSAPSTSQGKPGEKNLLQAVTDMLEKLRTERQKEFKPSARALATLKEMGFKEEDAEEALRITGNNQNSACEWLLGDRRRSLQDLDEGLDPDSAICQAIMNNASVQLSLNNPRMLLAFLSMLENPNSSELWLNDPEAAPVLNTIFKIYHSEKHLNRFS